MKLFWINEMKLLSIVVVLISIIMIYRYYSGTRRFYETNVSKALSADSFSNHQIIKEEDLLKLPIIVQKYLNYVGVVGKKRVNQFVIEVDGKMRLDKEKGWSPVKADQTTFIQQGTRLFYMMMNYNGISINGLHHFEEGKASMVIKILDLIKVVDIRGEAMNIAETVTFFNDLCIFAPSALIDANITWEEIDDLSVWAHYTNEDITVSAELYFNEEGQLINFISNDRYEVKSENDYNQITWSTPVRDYKRFNGYNLASIGEAIWHYDDGDFTYIKLNIKNVYYSY